MRKQAVILEPVAGNEVSFEDVSLNLAVSISIFSICLFYKMGHAVDAGPNLKVSLL